MNLNEIKHDCHTHECCRIQRDIEIETALKTPLKINLACGMRKKEGVEWVNIDSNSECKPDVVRNLMRGLPYSNETIDEINCEHFIEHLNGEDFIFFFNECHRVLKEGGRLCLKAPYHSEKWAWIDPTHKRPISEHSFDFFINCDYNSQNAGVTGWYLPESLNITGGEIDVVISKLKKPSERNYAWVMKQ